MSFKIFAINEKCSCGNTKTITPTIFHNMGATPEDMERAKNTGIASGSAIDGKYKRCWVCQKSKNKQQYYERMVIQGLDMLKNENPAPVGKEWTIAYAPVKITNEDNMVETQLQLSYVLVEI